MKHLITHLLLALFLGLSPQLFAQPDCGCPAPDWEASLEKANVVIIGTCIGIVTNPIKGGLNVVFQVDSSWKRSIEPNATLHTEAEINCGFPFEKGKRYLAFGNKRHQTIETSICEPNLGEGAEMEAAIAGLGKAFQPGTREIGRQMNILILGLGLGAVLFLALVVLRKRIFKRK